MWKVIAEVRKSHTNVALNVGQVGFTQGWQSTFSRLTSSLPLL